MVTVEVKTKNPNYDGSMLGYKFHRGLAKDVVLEDAEYMKKHFGVEFEEPEKPKPKKQPTKRKPSKKGE